MMKRILMIVSVAAFLTACNSGKNEKGENQETTAENGQSTGSFGAKIDEAGAIPVSQLIAEMSTKTEMDAKVEGTITECCKKKGCWMNIDKGDGTTMKVTFKDYGFFVPKDAGGKTAIMQGHAYMDTVSVETLKHYAEDAGKPQEEIDKITEPKFEMAFEAEGVIIK